MNTYKTADLAGMFGVHVNTVRLYEKCGLIPEPKRSGNGYRVFTDLHVEQMRLARAALQVEVLQNGLRRQAVNIIKRSAAGDYEMASMLVERYASQIDQEIKHGEEAIRITRSLLSGAKAGSRGGERVLKRKEAAEELGVTMDTLRNWELNGLFTIRRMENGYRVYTGEDMRRLKIIRSLRCANYSLSSILRMLQALQTDPDTDIRTAINTPHRDDDIITACDKLLTSLYAAKENAGFAAGQIEKMRRMGK